MSEKDLPKCEFAFIDSILNVNFDPHPFMIGPKHVAMAADHYGGVLGPEVLERVPCADRSFGQTCRLSPAEHKSDKVGFIKLTRDCTKAELQAWLVSIKPWLESEKIDGVAFIETGFRPKDNL